ncbi:E3 SUMO-protein ligase ZBED1-like [Aphidius gifuensis]|uniref:E3 SUMO-protein ligase ZBED1-like n=1 Tax=Aphidius gifuensis TaxID=684658 RepID=UPI001CDBBC32|nr:E3 SUMO-protein ligase ZBED1-like [Aphidius gifuensis]
MEGKIDSRRQSSNVWSYFESDSSDLCVAHCKLCQTRVKRAQGTSNLRSHMMKHHPAIWNRQTQQYKASNYLNSPSTSESCDEPLPKKQLTSKTPKITEVFSKITSLAPGGHTHDELTNAILFMIAKDKLPMSMVENEGFRYLCSKFKPLYNIPSRKTISTALEDRYKILKERFVTQIQQATTYSLTLDNWSDRTKQTYIAVTIHYLNNQWELIDGTIGMFPLYDNHTAEYLKNAIEFILDDFKLEKAKIVGVTTDRAANILKAVHELFGPKKQVSCFCHMLAQLFPDFMEGMSKLQIVIKKVRAIVNAVRVSTCASTKLKNLQKAKGIQEGDCLAFELDVSTRWNSTLYMIKKFLILKDYVLSTTEECAFPPELLQHEDYQILDDVIPLMELVENATKEASKSKYPTASLVVPLLANIKIAIGNCKTQTQCGKEFQNKFTDALERRGRDLEANDILGIATILDPRFKKKSIWDIHDDFMEKRNPSEHVLPEIKQYLNQQLWPRQTNPIQVWKDQLKPSFPGLYPLAMMYLSVPCSSVPSERINSQAGDIKTVTRNRITGEHLNELLFLSSLTLEQWGLK